MAISKVVYGDDTLIDLTGDTVTADTLVAGKTAHSANGAAITGTLTVQQFYTGASAPDASVGSDGDLFFVTGE